MLKIIPLDGDSATGEPLSKHVYSALFARVPSGAEATSESITVSFSQFLIFVSEQWLLVFALLLSLNLLLFTESKKAGPALSPQQAINLTTERWHLFLM